MELISSAFNLIWFWLRQEGLWTRTMEITLISAVSAVYVFLKCHVMVAHKILVVAKSRALLLRFRFGLEWN